ncbi:glutathione S-transferase family protein [Martelella lutilitoris]|uniref:Glutathione S-transferase family protein n=1 Tax=Martelella lutilitoris TaxID=2583532 RepID=A0A5C4JTQ2_9HYPH|nr:glutathione S-transferase family protein [Martelella lutilitoris]TNB48835.1 glutathione S-transferase family protein [Martelella lutilitoris]
MSDLTLFIGNKRYSSWSLRPWLAMEASGIPFKEVLIPFDFPAGNPRFREISPVGMVPVLHHGKARIWESLAIIEYVAELYPEAQLWPEDRIERAAARALSAEMHAGFRALRGACPMNFGRKPAPLAIDDAVKADVARIKTMWRDALEASGGPFLFGSFTAADAMYAPVVNRFEIYELADSTPTLAYMNAVKSLPAFQRWRDGALAESWVVPEDEV